jgi:uncharacterized membrane protein YbhN (UPF0104 family)
VPHILETLRERGLETVTVTQLAEQLRPQRRTAFKAAAFAIVVAALVLLVSQRFSLQVIANVFTDVDPVFVLAALIANLGSVAAKSLTWKAALDAVPGDDEGRPLDVSVREVIPAIFIGFLLNTVLIARLGEVARVTVLRRKLVARGRSVPVTTLVGTLVTEPILSGIMLVGCWWAWSSSPVPQQAVRLAVLSGSSSSSRSSRRGSSPAASSGVAWCRRRPTSSAGGTCSASASSTMRGLREGRRSSAARASGWGLVATISWIMQQRASTGPSGVRHRRGPRCGGVVFLASNLVQLFPITPGNLGVFQGATAGGLSVLYPVASDLALTFSIGLQLIEAALGVGVGFIFLSLEGLSVAELRRQVEDESAT